MLKQLTAVSLSLLLVLPLSFASADMSKQAPMEFAQTVWKVAIEEGISVDEAIESMKLRANTLNMKLVAHQPLSKELKAQGVKDVRRMEIFQFCDAQIAKKMVDYDPTFAAYMPCRIAVITDTKDQNWLITLNMDMIMGMVTLSPELQVLAKKVRDNIHEIVHAGAAGEL